MGEARGAPNGPRLPLRVNGQRVPLWVLGAGRRRACIKVQRGATTENAFVARVAQVVVTYGIALKISIRGRLACCTGRLGPLPETSESFRFWRKSRTS